MSNHPNWYNFCASCFGTMDSDSPDVTVIDLTSRGVTDVPPYIFLYERTLVKLLLGSNKIKDLALPLFRCETLAVLALDGNDLETIPPAIGSLVNLEFLDVSCNCITDISDNIRSCKKLVELNFSMNPIKQFPEGVTHLIALEKLYVSDTRIKFIPANIGRLIRLKIFEIRDNSIVTLPKSMARLTNLECLDIGNNKISSIPEAVGDLSNLQYLYIDGNNIKEVPAFIGKLEKLVHLEGSETKIKKMSPNIGMLRCMTHLDLSKTNLKVLPSAIGHAEKLLRLDLESNRLQCLPQTIGFLQNLRYLHLANNKIDHLPSSIGLLRSLSFLDLSSNLLTELPPEIGSCVNLSVLLLQLNNLESIPAEIGNLISLKACNLINNHLKYLPMSVLKLRNLKALWLAYNQARPLTSLVKEFNQESNTLVLTCYLLPQRDVLTGDSGPSKSSSDERQQSRPRIRFSFNSLLDRQSHFSRVPTPYPRRSRNCLPKSESLQDLDMPDNGNKLPVANLPSHEFNRDEVKVAIVKKKIPSQPPPYEVAAKKSKHAVLYEKIEDKGNLDSTVAVSNVDKVFDKSISPSTSDSSHSSYEIPVNDFDENDIQGEEKCFVKETVEEWKCFLVKNDNRNNINDNVEEWLCTVVVKDGEEESECILYENDSYYVESAPDDCTNGDKNDSDKTTLDKNYCELKSVHQVDGISSWRPVHSQSSSDENYNENEQIEVVQQTQNSCVENIKPINVTSSKSGLQKVTPVKVITPSLRLSEIQLHHSSRNEKVETDIREDRSSQSVVSFPKGVNSSSVSFEKESSPEKPRTPWLFGAHKNATVVEVEITKENCKLGFQLESHESGFYVSDVNLDSPAAAVLCKGDKVLQIDGVNLRNVMKVEDVISLLADFSRPFTMLISRM